MSTKTLLGALCLLLAGATASADVVRIPVGQQTANAAMSLPQTGVTKARVRETHGEPMKAEGPTGDPAIYRWDYRDFTVYFEGDRVIHTVVNFVADHPQES